MAELLQCDQCGMTDGKRDRTWFQLKQQTARSELLSEAWSNGRPARRAEGDLCSLGCLRDFAAAKAAAAVEGAH